MFTSQWIYSGGIKRYFTVFLFEEKGFNPFSFGSFQPFRNDAFIGFLSMFAYVGSIIGYWLSGYFGDRFGRKNSIYGDAFSVPVDPRGQPDPFRHAFTVRTTVRYEQRNPLAGYLVQYGRASIRPAGFLERITGNGVLE